MGMNDRLNETDDAISQNELDTEDSTQLTDWANEPTIQDLKQNIDDASSDLDTHKTNVNRWLENRAAVRKKVEGKSSVQPKLIRKQAEWRYSSLADPFLSTPDIFNVYPKTAGDVNRARQNGMVLNHQFNTRMDKVQFIDDYVREAVDIGTVIVKTGWITKEEEVIEKVRVYNYMPDQTGQLQQYYMELLKLRLADPEAYADSETPGLNHALDMFQQTGVASFVEETDQVNEVTKIEETMNQPDLEIVSSENIIIDPTCNGDMSKAKFIGEKFKSSLSDLKADGKYTNLDKIEVNSAANPISEPDFKDESDAETFEFKDKPRKQFVVWTYWGEWDIDGTGEITKQIVATWVGNTIIRMEENPFPDRKPPFVKAVYMPVRDSIFGEPDGELLKDNQDIIGAVTRGAIDLLAKSANSQTGMRKDMLDVTNKRKFNKGMDYEFNAGVDPGQGVYQHKFPEIPRSVFDMLTVQNSEAESLTGVKNFGEGLNSASLGNVASNAGRVIDAASRRELGILRRLSSGIIEIGRKVIAMNAEFLSEEEVVRVTDNKFIQVRRDDLAGKFDLRLTISTAEEDLARAQELAFMLQTAGPHMDLEFMKMILAEIARLRKMPDLAKRIEEFQPQPDPMAVAMQEKEMELKDAQIEKEHALAYKHRAEGDAAYGRGKRDDTQGELNMAKAGEASAKGRLHSSEADAKDLDYLQEEDGTKHIRELEKDQNKESSRRLTELIKGAQQKQSAEKSA